MCGRYKLVSSDEQAMSLFELTDSPSLTPRFNITPSQPVRAVRAGRDRPRQWATLRWGLVPSWADDPSIGNGLINARAETAATKPSFRQALRSRRCLVLADGFYEWKPEGKHKYPYHIRMRGGRLFAFAGLWDRWSQPRSPDAEQDRAADDPPIESCTLLTTEPNELMAPLHHRMPVILDREDFELWLDPDVRDPEAIEHLLRPYSAEDMEAFPVSKRVNNPAHDDAACAEAIELGLHQ